MKKKNNLQQVISVRGIYSTQTGFCSHLFVAKAQVADLRRGGYDDDDQMKHHIQHIPKMSIFSSPDSK
ncbi:hypothetical protein BGZ63DRAFT_83825 [Mariannaea sp. PMI_226]|nr:hypothetical protein BGZ63DRAFT_83825 [Mariannaea sp. PMI_226]